MIDFPEYKRPWYLFNGHLESIIPYKTYKIYELAYERERIELQDGDFLDIDWVKNSHDKLIVISHALEGNSRDYFVERAAKYFSSKGYDVLMWHFRSCSKEMNRLPRFYHTGDIHDLDTVVKHGLHSGKYNSLFMLGFSMGGTTTINYLGSDCSSVRMVEKAVTFSTPLDLKETSERLSTGINQIYGQSFLTKWKRKIKRKADQFPEHFDLSKLHRCTTLDQLHDSFTVKLHGYNSIADYYEANSSKRFLKKISTPLLLVNAKNDPLLGPGSYEQPSSQFVQELTMPKGGHLGFSVSNQAHSWMEIVSELFFEAKQHP